MRISIRQETNKDFEIVESLRREAFWNLHVPGCDEHYLAFLMRTHEDFIPELSLVAEKDGQVVGSIMYTKSYVLDESGKEHSVITFGPLSVHPKFQHQGVGRALINRSKAIAIEMGYKAIIIYGYPHDYCKHGFLSCKLFGITDTDGNYPFAMLVLELENGALNGIKGKAFLSEVYDVDVEKVFEYDKAFPQKERIETYSQNEFAIASTAYLL